MKEVAGDKAVEERDSAVVSPERRCTQVLADGRRCRQKAWRGKGICYQHDPAAARLRKKAGRPARADVPAGEPRKPARLMTVAAVQELLAGTVEELREKRITPGEAYAAGYLAQLALAALGAARRESKMDVKQFWEMVDLGAAFEKAAEMQKERKKEREAKEAQEADPSTRPAGSLRASEAEEAEEA